MTFKSLANFKKRIVVGKLPSSMIEDLRYLSAKKDTSTVAFNPKIVPDDEESQNVILFFQTTLNSLIESEYLLSRWWSEAGNILGCSDITNLNVDFLTCEVYREE